MSNECSQPTVLSHFTTDTQEVRGGWGCATRDLEDWFEGRRGGEEKGGTLKVTALSFKNLFIDC